MSVATFSLTKVGQVFGTSFEAFSPTLVDMRSFSAFPYDWALYTSTDHDAGAGGIHLYVCDGDPTDTANWSDYDTEETAGGFDSIVSRPANNPIYTDSTEGDQTETPCVNIIGSTVYMTYHQDSISGEQRTLLATSTDGLNFTRYTTHTGGSSAIILEPDPDEGGAHTGYFSWGPNPFSGISEDYVGYSVYVGGNYSTAAQWVSDDGINWTTSKAFLPIEATLGLPTSPAQWRPGISNIDVGSIKDLGGGEYLAITTCASRGSGGAAREASLYEIVMNSDGTYFTRTPREVLAQGAASSFDEDQVRISKMLAYGSGYVGIYNAVNASNQNSLGLFTATESTATEPPQPYPRNDDYDTEIARDFRATGSFPTGFAAFTQGSASASFDSDGLQLTGDEGSFAGIHYSTGFIPDDYDMIEFAMLGAKFDGTSIDTVLIGIGDAAPNSPTEGVFFNSNTGFSSEFRVIEREGGVSNIIEDSEYLYTGLVPNHEVGIRWYPRLRKLQLLTAGGLVVNEWTTSATIDTSSTMVAYGAMKDMDATIQQIRFRLQADDTAAPTVSSVEVTGNSLTATFSKPIDYSIGGLDGFALTASGGAATLAYSSGLNTDTITFNISRSVASSETVTLAYTQPTNGWMDGHSNELATFSGQSVTVNDVPASTSISVSVGIGLGL